MFRSLFLCFAAASLVCCLPQFSIASVTIYPSKTVEPPIKPSFTLSAPTPTALTLIQGQAGMATMSLTGNAAFYGEVKLTCSGAPPGLQCLVSPATTTLGVSQSTLATVAIATQGAVTNLSINQTTKAFSGDGLQSSGLSGFTRENNPHGTLFTDYTYWRSVLVDWTKTTGTVGLAGALFFWIDTRWFRRWRGSAARTLTLLVLVAGIGAFVTGCGSWRAPKPAATPLGVSTLTITAVSGNISQTQRLTVTVTHP